MIRKKLLKAGVITLAVTFMLALTFDAQAQRGGRGGGSRGGGRSSGGGNHGGGGGNRGGGGVVRPNGGANRGGGPVGGGHVGGGHVGGGHVGGGHVNNGGHVGGRPGVAHGGFAGTHARIGHVGGHPYSFYGPRFHSSWYHGYWFRPYGWAGWGYGWHYGWNYNRFWWAGSPWWNWYGAYWTPNYYYYDQYYYLSDYIMGTMMSRRGQAYASAYDDEDGEVPAPAANQSTMPDAQKTQLHNQVQAEMNARQNNTTVDFADKLKDPNHSYVISGQFKVIMKGVPANADGSLPTCNLGSGDIVQVAAHAPVDQAVIDMMVVSSMSSDCAVGKVVTIAMSELVTSENAFNAFLDQGAEAAQNDATLSSSLANPPKEGASMQPGFQPANAPQEPQQVTSDDGEE